MRSEAYAQKMGEGLESPKLSGWRITLSRLKLFNVLSGQYWRMPRRPLSRFCFGLKAGTYFFDIDARSESDAFERGALALGVEFYTLLGKRVKNHVGGYVLTLPVWSDASAVASEQRVYLEVPEGAFAAQITLSRTKPQTRTDIASSFSLTRFEPTDVPNIMATLKGRDEGYLRYHLEKARSVADRETAQSLLERLIYLFDRNRDRQLLRVLKLLDAAAWIEASSQVVDEATEPYKYVHPFSPVPDSAEDFMPWLECEALHLKMLDKSNIQIVGPDSLVERLLAVKFADLYVSVDDLPQIDGLALNGWANEAYVADLVRVG